MDSLSPRLCACGCGQPVTSRRKFVTFIWGHHMRVKFPPLEARFWARIDKTSHPGGCWVWTGIRNVGGYGVLSYRLPNGKCHNHGAHRFSYELHNGPIPDGLFVCHHCDNPACVNPAHLFLGDHRANGLDCIRKNRHGAVTHPECQPRGDKNGSRLHPEKLRRGELASKAKLTSDQVREIRRRLKSSEATYRELSIEFHVTAQAIRAIELKKSWRHILD